MAAEQTDRTTEWVGGITTLPSYITGEGEPYRPEAVFWMSAEGAILGTVLARPGELLAEVAASLQETMESPAFGEPHTPDRLRVSSPELAEAVRAGHPSLEVVHGPTPEIDAMLAVMEEQFDQLASEEAPVFDPAIEPEAVASFFRAAACLFRAAPWDAVAMADDVIGVSVEELGVDEAVVSVIGQTGPHRGLILFSSVEDFDAYLVAGDSLERGEPVEIPAHTSFHFERAAEVSPLVREEVFERGWELAGQDAYPLPVVLDEDLFARPLTAREMALLEAVAGGLVELVRDPDAVEAASDGEAELGVTARVQTAVGEVEVEMWMPWER